MCEHFAKALTDLGDRFHRSKMWDKRGILPKSAIETTNVSEMGIFITSQPYRNLSANIELKTQLIEQRCVDEEKQCTCLPTQQASFCRNLISFNNLSLIQEKQPQKAQQVN